MQLALKVAYLVQEQALPQVAAAAVMWAVGESAQLL
jgi:hypothetical protein